MFAKRSMLLFVFVSLMISVAVVTAEGVERRHTHAPRLDHGPLDFEMDTKEDQASVSEHKAKGHDSVLEELFEEQGNLQISAQLSAGGPLTRADFNGEKPYEEEDINVGDSNPSSSSSSSTNEVTNDVQSNVQYSELPSIAATTIAVDIATVPKMLNDGRLVRVPVEDTTNNNNNNNNEEEKTSTAAKDDLVAPDVNAASGEEPKTETNEQQVIADAQPTASHTDNALTEGSTEIVGGGAVDVSVKDSSDIQLLQTEAGLGEGGKKRTIAMASAGFDDDAGPSLPFEAKKVRVTSLISGIISSTMSSVLTRGMEFTSARSN